MVKILLDNGNTIVIDKGIIVESPNKIIMQNKYGFGSEGASPSIPDPDLHIADLILRDYKGRITYQDETEYDSEAIY